jgi:folate-binding protein YgfZ
MTLNRLEITDRSALNVCGPESEAFLQSILSNDMTGLTPGQPVYSLLLTPQGKVMFDLIAWRLEDGFMIEVEKPRSTELEKKLKLYKLRADVDISLESLTVTCLWGDIPEPLDKDLPFDPRHKGLGLRLPDLDIFSSLNFDNASETATEEMYQSHRIALKVPQGSDEIPQDQAFPLEYGLHELAGIDFQKGCYVGQEVTSRTYRRGKIRKSLYRCSAHDIFSSQDKIMSGDRQVGEICLWQGEEGLALLRDDSLEENLTVNDIALRIQETQD